MHQEDAVIAGRRIEIRGTVQGVGFRPWVYRLAREMGVGGRVRNHSGGVTIEAFACESDLGAFVARLRLQAPAPARVRELKTTRIPAERVADFVIDASEQVGGRVLSIPPDLATCAECEHEVSDPSNRRFGYAFTNCTHCGPRFSIAESVPYDRARTTMAGFTMCPACAREYADPSDRRFHAQPNACPDCGPRLSLWDASGAPLDTATPLAAAAVALRRGDIVAIKGLGGYHLACDARREDVVARLRARKRRDHKPFAVMVRDLVGAHAIAMLRSGEVELLAGPERPIVLVRRWRDAAIAPSVAPETPLVGLMLPYSPLHHLLMAQVDGPLVMTSGNLAGEPIVTDEADAVARLGGVADALLVHDRRIASRCDDSVARLVAGRPVVLRRSRGFAPRALAMAHAVAEPVLACGAHLKNTFCMAAGDLAYLGPHVGDLDTLEAAGAFEDAVARMEDVLGIRPRLVAHDQHPAYASTRYAQARASADAIAVQHHHAHAVSAMVENGLEGPVIAVVYDGTGHGTDGTSWGGEILLVRPAAFERLGSFRPIGLPGGDAAIREIWRAAYSVLWDAYDGRPPVESVPVFAGVAPSWLAGVDSMLSHGLGVPRARGVGRYFDAIGAMVLGRRESRHEGEVAVALEHVAGVGNSRAYSFDIDRRSGLPEIDLRPTVRSIVLDLDRGVSAAEISARFHATLLVATTVLVRSASRECGRLPVVLSGGAMQNDRLVAGLLARLGGEFAVYTHREVPPGDGGLALGQAVVADAVARAGGAA